MFTFRYRYFQYRKPFPLSPEGDSPQGLTSMAPDFKTVSVIGLGYIGLPTAAIMATHGLHVVGVDVNPRVVDTINSGKIHIVEPELDALVSGVVSSGRLRATLRPEEADAFIIAVPTPFHDDNAPDLSY